MDWKIFFTTFGTIFLAELADKTELAVLSLSAKTKSPWPIFWGALCAFAVATLIALVLGDLVAKCVPIHIIRFVSAGIFIFIGVLILLGKS